MTDMPKTVREVLQAIHDMGNAKAQEVGQMTLGSLRDALRALPPETPIVLDGPGSHPTSLASYRGYYERLAIGWGNTHYTETQLVNGGPAFDSPFTGYYSPGAPDVEIRHPATAADLIQALDIADGEVFDGYKGGQFQMNSDTWLHVANYGDVGPAVVGLSLSLTGDGFAVIQTAEVD
jgi:hypothetical protein